MLFKASVWKLSKSVIETADELELRGHILSIMLICFLYVFDFLANNFQKPKMMLSHVQEPSYAFLFYRHRYSQM